MIRPRRCLALAALAASLGAFAGTACPAAAPELSEAARWLQGYLRIDTTNPPGGEGRAAAYLADILRREGIPSRLLPAGKGRANLWARLAAPGSGGRAVVLLHHMDVVAPGPGWSVRPFSGLVQDGRLWGRGAVDDKSLGIAQLAAFIDLERRRARLERDVVFLAVVDEENGGRAGTERLLSRHPELFRGVEGVVGEGGRNQFVNGRLLWWGVEVAQKRPLWLAVEATGRGGHGSGLNPGSANHQLLSGLARLLEVPPRGRITPPARAYVEALAPLHNESWRSMVRRLDEIVTGKMPTELLFPGLANLFLDTVQVTVLDGGERINVIPERARARLDVRLLPDTDARAFLAELRRALGDRLAVEVLLTAPPAAASAPSGRLYRAMAGVLGREGPVVPAFISGFTDSRFFRERGIAAYGLAPFLLEAEDLRGIHGPDERIPLAELDRGVERTRRIVAAYAAAPPP